MVAVSISPKDEKICNAPQGVGEAHITHDVKDSMTFIECKRSFKLTHFRPLKSTQKRPLNIYHPMRFHAGDSLIRECTEFTMKNLSTDGPAFVTCPYIATDPDWSTLGTRPV
ncbi:MAG: hypothetical protein AMDU2_EPLC00006G0660 [Thermoplasmatales archaeon E-plasma]|jgi:hypothetical protein|nr:MAG: hypothetical protein AMDU2_EPLC00006G0660 [Thermoplasmatales archaeon E-plasma]